METQKLTAFINDSSELAVNLEWAGVAFEPGEDWALIFTAKDSDSDLDSEAVFQKASGAGITVSGSVATVGLVPTDTESLSDGKRLFDVQAQNILTQKVRTVAFGEVYIMRDITRLTETSVPVLTSQDPLPFARTAVEIHAATTKATPIDADEFGFWDSVSGLLRKATWANIGATLKAYFDTLYSVLGHGHAHTEITGLGTAALVDVEDLTSTGYRVISGAGIDPTGATDSTDAIHAIMDAAVAAGIGTVYFPSGTYKCSLVITSTRKHLSILGAGCGSLDDWSGTSTPATTLKPNSNSLPALKYEALGSARLCNLEIEGNGAGTSALGIAFEGSTPGTYIGGGFVAENVVVRKFTRNGYSDGGGQITFRNCGLFQGNYGFDISDSVFAHTYEFEGVSVGGTPASGTGRCYEVKGSNCVTILNGEHGNCTDFLYQAGTQAPRVDVHGGNWETFSASKIIEVTRGTYNQVGGRLSLLAGVAYLRANPATSYSDRYRGLYGISLIGVRAPGIKEADGSYGAYACTLYQHNGELPYPTIRQAGTSAFCEEWNSDFSSMASRKLVGDNDPLDARSGPLLASEISDLTGSIEWENFANFAKIRPSIRQVYTSASGGGAANFDQGSFIYTSATAGSFGKAVLATTITTYSAWTGAAVPSATPAFACVWGSMKTIPTDDTSRLRIIVGDSVATPVSSNTQPISANGYGAEVYYDAGSSSVKVRAFGYNGSYSESAGVAFPVTYGKTYTLLVGQDGAGNVKIYGAVSTGAGDIAEPSLLITHPGCPTTGFLSSNSISVIATSKSSGTCSAVEVFIHRAATGVIQL